MDNEERKEKLEEKAKLLRERELNDVRKLLLMPEGRRLLWRIMSLAETFLATTTDKRIIGLTLFADIMDTKPNMFIQMSRENKSEQESIQKQYPIDEEEI